MAFTILLLCRLPEANRCAYLAGIRIDANIRINWQIT